MTPLREPVGRLVLCPTPIGNPQDVTLRVLAALGEADVVACEDTRHTGRLLSEHRLSVALVSFHEHNERARTPQLIARMREGAVVALVSDAGMPVVSDPGFALVQACVGAGIAVQVLPGPSAVPTALVASGLPADRWCFGGFLPRSAQALSSLLAEADQTLVAFESPRRLARTLALLAAIDPERPVAVCRELTKTHEEVRRAGAAELAEHYAAAPAKGEIVLVIGAGATRERRREELAVKTLSELVDAGARPRRAAAAVARLSGMRANDLYRELTAGARSADAGQ